jgi:DNA-binding CsgD family transcriptional regulator
MTAQLARVGEFVHAYNLTRAEERVLQRLLAGDELRTAARTIHISIHTARNHLKSILQKTGRRSQSQLLAIATRVAALQLPEI